MTALFSLTQVLHNFRDTLGQVSPRLQLKICPLALAVVTLLPAYSSAWNIPTHMVHGAMTYQIVRQENPSAVASVRLILEHHPWHEKRWSGQVERTPEAERDELLFMLAARWADDVRTQDRQQHRGQWHYINFPFKPAGEPESIEVRPPPKPNILTAMAENNRVVTSVEKSTPRSGFFPVPGMTSWLNCHRRNELLRFRTPQSLCCFKSLLYVWVFVRASGGTCWSNRLIVSWVPSVRQIGGLVTSKNNSMDPRRLEGVWFHSYEEDSGDRRVYRGRSYEFPKSRAPRASMTIKPDGTVAFGRPGPADAAVYDVGKWDLNNNILTLYLPGRRDVYEIESVDGDMLVLRRLQTRQGTDGENR